MINYFRKHPALFRLLCVISFLFYLSSCFASWLYSGQYDSNNYPYDNWVATLAVIWGFHLAWGILIFGVLWIVGSFINWIINGDVL